MKPFYLLIGLVVLGALAAPFFLTINGEPLMTIDEALEDATPDVLQPTTEIYRWQDEHGVWQFGEQPPANASGATSVELEDKITGLGREWHGGGRRQAPTETPRPIPGVAGLLQGKEVMDAARTQAGNISKRTEHIDAALQDVRSRQ